MRFDDLIKPPAKKQKPLTYTESLESKLKAQMLANPTSRLITKQCAIMEDGGSVEESNQGRKK